MKLLKQTSKKSLSKSNSLISSMLLISLISILLGFAGCKSPLKEPDKTELKKAAPETFQIKFETSRGDFIMEIYRSWSSNGADRVYYLVNNKFYDNVRFFRVIKGFMAQFGYHGDPTITKAWSDLAIQDDPVKESNLRGYVTFAKTGLPNSRTTQLYINFGDNSNLDGMGFAPIGKVIEGMEIVDALYCGYGEGPPRGYGPDQSQIKKRGNSYLKNSFPELDYIKKARIIPAK